MTLAPRNFAGIRLCIALLLLLALAACSGKSRDQLFAEGVAQLEKDPAGAIVYFRKALEKDPAFAAARVELGVALLRSGKARQSETELQKVLRQEPTNRKARIWLAKAQNAQQKPDEALATVAADSGPASDGKEEVVGLALALKSDYAGAEEHLRRAIALRQGNIEARVYLAELCQERGRGAEAKALLEDALKVESGNRIALYALAKLERKSGHRDEALKVLAKMAALYPREAAPLYESGVIQLNAGKIAEAEAMASVLSRSFPKRGETAMLKGLLALNAKRNRDAIGEFQTALKRAPTLEGHYYLGLGLFRNGDYEQALSQFRKVIDVDAVNRPARLLSGLTLLRQKRYDEAAAEAKKLLEKDPRDGAAHELLGNAFIGNRSFDDGIRELNVAVECDPSLAEAHVQKGVVRLTTGKPREAEQDFVNAVASAPGSLNSRLLLAQYYLRMKNEEKALRTLRAGIRGGREDAVLHHACAGICFGLGREEEGVAEIAQAKKADPAFADPYFLAAAHLFAKGDRQKARGEYDALLRRDPANVRGLVAAAAMEDIGGNDREALALYTRARDCRKPEGFMALAGYHLKKKDVKKALSVLDAAAREFPKEVAVLETRGRILLREKQYREALKVFQEVEELAPDDGLTLRAAAFVAMGKPDRALAEGRRMVTLHPRAATGYLLLAAVHQAGGNVAAATEEVKKGLAVEPRSLRARMTLGELYARAGRHREALALYDSILRENPGFAPACTARGTVLEMTGNTADAIAAYRAALSKSGHDVQALNNLAFLYAGGRGNAEEALRLAVTAYRLDPGNANILDTLGFALLKAGKTESSVKVLEKVSSLLPDNRTVLYHLGLAYSQAGKGAQAAAALRRAVSGGTFPEKGEATALLARLR